ncbi:hypothetical protein SAY87_009890 [Trapa incisa]|uniref:PUB 62/63 C-terminal domain-containing protein n=1 Tax=Trapa incisa TaxID=236973 RepID=A0AAN7JWB7_9MYRT|nr:hypothetical protein SAY87_009890 [Trapa incisa]
MTSIVAPAPASESALVVARVRLSDIAPYDGSPGAAYLRAVEALSESLMRYNAAVIELEMEDAVLMRCGLEAARLYLRTRVHPHTQTAGKGNIRGVYTYRAGRTIEDCDSSPTCMAEIFRRMGKAARAALCAIARHLHLRCEVFTHLLDETPLPANEVSSSVLVAYHSPVSWQNGKDTFEGGKPAINGEVEKGLVTLICSDSPGLEVCDPNGQWYLADTASSPSDLLLITGKALSHVTAGLRPAAFYRASLDYCPVSIAGGRTSLAFRLMPQGNAILDCTPIASAGHAIPQNYVPISFSQFMDDLSAEEDALCQGPEKAHATGSNQSKEQTLRSVLSDPISGAFLEDAMVISCGHSFGGMMLERVIEMARCILCSTEIGTVPLIPNHALRAAASAVKHEDDRRLLHNVALRKRQKEMVDQTIPIRRCNMGNEDGHVENGLHKGVQYPFSVNEKVFIKGNKRTPEKFVGKEAVITSQCLNGWYLLKIIGSEENVRLQYRSLKKIRNSEANEEERCNSHQMQNGSP